MSGDVDRVTAVRTVTIKHMLATPIFYGEWVMRHREFALVRVDAESGLRGFAYCLTRDGPVAEIVSRSIAPVYVGAAVASPAEVFYRALWTNHAVHAAGIGMRALSVVDIAAWDLAAKAAGKPIAAYLGGELRPLPATAIVGYPPTMSAAETARQVEVLWEAGWRRFKVPISPPWASRWSGWRPSARPPPKAGSVSTSTWSCTPPKRCWTSRSRYATSAWVG